MTYKNATKILVIFITFLFVGCMQNRLENNDKLQTSQVIEINTTNISATHESQIVVLDNGSAFSLDAKPATKIIDGKRFPMLAYNGQIPGPTLKLKQGSKIRVNFTNDMDYETTVHWHGLRLQNKYDGVPSTTQPMLKKGESFTYELEFPDSGIYWYHPHVREDMQQELGLYGAIIVEPDNQSSQDYNKVDTEKILILDDLLMNDNKTYPFPKDSTNFALMGRFGNTLMINGQTNYSISAKRGEVLRFYLINSANVRPFNFSIEGVSLKVVGADNGLYEKEFFADAVVLTPSERAIVEVSFNKTGKYNIMNNNPLKSYIIGQINIEGGNDTPQQYYNVKNNTYVQKSIDPFRPEFNRLPDFRYELTIQVPGAVGMMSGMMDHNEDGIEWEDSMQMMNSRSTNQTLTWAIKDKNTGKTNMDAMNRVLRDKIVKIRIENPKGSMHPMQHSIHLHGTRFLVLEENGQNIANKNLVWKDSVNIPIGGSVELLTSFPNEGEWMMHCHIAEHLSSDMMSSFMVSNS